MQFKRKKNWFSFIDKNDFYDHPNVSEFKSTWNYDKIYVL